MRRHVSEDVYMISLWYLQLLDVLNEIGGDREITLVGEVLDALHAATLDVSRISRLFENLQREAGAWMGIPVSDDIDAFLRVRFDQEHSARHLLNGVAAAEEAWAARVAAAGTAPLPTAAAPAGRRNMAPPLNPNFHVGKRKAKELAADPELLDHYRFLYSAGANCLMCTEYWLSRGADIRRGTTNHERWTAYEFAKHHKADRTAEDRMHVCYLC
eukprot:s3399_g9.t1